MRRRQVRPGTTIWKAQGEEPPYLNIRGGDTVWVWGKPGTLAMNAEYRRAPYSKKNPYRGLVALEDLLQSERGKTGTSGVGRVSRRFRSSTTGGAQ